MPSRHLTVVANPEAVAHATLRLFVTAAEKAIEARGSFAVALAGGSTPQRLYQLLAKGPLTEPKQWPFDWSKVEIYFGDERCVPPDHAESNYRIAEEELLSKVPIPRQNIFRMRGEIKPNEAAKEYGELLKARFGEGGLDMALLGMGEDGHTASLFPYTEALQETKHRCVAHFVEKSTTGKSWRLTMTVPFLNRSAEAIVMVAGAAKAARIKEVWDGPVDGDRLPIQRIQPAGPLIWIVDEAAAERLGNPPRKP
jgi:6-phosphogluconolactonase